MPAKLMILDLINGQNSIGTLRYCIILSGPIAIYCLKSAFNAAYEGRAGIQDLAGNATIHQTFWRPFPARAFCGHCPASEQRHKKFPPG